MKAKDKDANPVGYKKPPQHTQFKPGQSGNPKGRPKKTSSLTEIVAREVRKKIQIVINGKRQRVSILVAIVKQHLSKAAAGDPKSVAILFSLLKDAPAETRNRLGEVLQELRAAHDRQVESEKDRY